MSSWYPFGGVGPYGTYGNLGLYGALVAYSSLNLTVTSPAQSFVEPLTVQGMYGYLKIPERSPVDDGEHDFISTLISAAREQAEILQNRVLVRKQFDMSFDYWPSYRLEMGTPLISVDLMQYMDWQGNVTVMQQASPANPAPGNATDNTDYYIVDTSKHPGVIAPPYNYTWPTFTPWPTSAILARFTVGHSNSDPFWQDAGARIKIGMKMLISGWYNNRIPFERGIDCTAEYPYAVTSCLSYGSTGPRAL